MKHSRRGRIIDLLNKETSDIEILAVLEKEFPSGLFSTSNALALAGTKWNLRKSGKGKTYKKPMPVPKPFQLPYLFNREELVVKLRSFLFTSIIERYRLRDLTGKSAKELLSFTMDKTIYRAFHHETPSLRYLRWRWHCDAELLLNKLNAIIDQEMFDRFSLEIGESLVTDWGTKNNLGEPTKMNIGIAMKITNLALKHLSYSKLSSNPDLIKWLHVPWDRFTLRPLQNIWSGNPAIPNDAGQGYVKDLDIYQRLHSLISGITLEAGVPRIIYEFWAWDASH